jgi:ferredoxin like protein
MSKIEDKLYMTRFKVDHHSHLAIIDEKVCEKCIKTHGQPCTIFCPAAVYVWDEGHMRVVYEGCLECGSCRIGCPYANIKWEFPRGGYGVQYKLG